MVYGNRLYGTAYIYFDAQRSARLPLFALAELSQPSFSGWSQVWTSGKSGFVAGNMSQVPSEWQAKLGGPAITGQCCIPIMTRTSFGPAAFAFDPSKVGQPKVRATPLLYYPADHATLGPGAARHRIRPSTRAPKFWASPSLRHALGALLRANGPRAAVLRRGHLE